MYIYSKKGHHTSKSRNRSARHRSQLRRKNTNRKLRVNGKKW